MTSRVLSREELVAARGTQLGLSDWIEITQGRIDAFAAVTDDLQPIHSDPAAARAAGFDGPVAHGFLTLSMLSALAYDGLPRIAGQTASVNYGFDKVRFITPVPAGSSTRARFILESGEDRGDQGLMLTLAVTLELQNSERPALSALWRVLFLF